MNNPLRDAMHPWGTDSMAVKTAKLTAVLRTAAIPANLQGKPTYSVQTGLLASEHVRAQGINLISSGGKHEQ